MRIILLLVAMLALNACGSMPMKRCDAPFAQPDVMLCEEQVQGAYRKCEKPVNLYQGCVSPQ